MPMDACQFFYDYKGCGERLKPFRAIAAFSALSGQFHAHRCKVAKFVAQTKNVRFGVIFDLSSTRQRLPPFTESGHSLAPQYLTPIARHGTELAAFPAMSAVRRSLPKQVKPDEKGPVSSRHSQKLARCTRTVPPTHRLRAFAEMPAALRNIGRFCGF